jgi:hypothetical protein
VVLVVNLGGGGGVWEWGVAVVWLGLVVVVLGGRGGWWRVSIPRHQSETLQKRDRIHVFRTVNRKDELRSRNRGQGIETHIDSTIDLELAACCVSMGRSLI